MTKLVLLPSDNENVWRGGFNYINLLMEALIEMESKNLLIVERTSNKRELDKFLEIIQIPWKSAAVKSRVINWIPDLQEVDLKSMFPLILRLRRRFSLLKKIIFSEEFYFSSLHTRNSFKESHPRAKIAGVVRFALNPNSQYAVSPFEWCSHCEQQGFIYVPNQWWKHKNHIYLIEEYSKYLSETGEQALHLVFSGKEFDYRFPGYDEEIRRSISKIENFVHTFGEIERTKQIYLFMKSNFIVQPSLYEGWSTSIEEGIFFNKNIVCLKLPNNLEQSDLANGVYFEDKDAGLRLSDLFLRMQDLTDPNNEIFVKKRWSRFLDDLSKMLNV